MEELSDIDNDDYKHPYDPIDSTGNVYLSNISSSYRVKCVLLGNTGVGKTTFCGLFANNELDPNISSTIGVGFASRTIILDNKQEIIIQLWDTAGSIRFHNIIQSYLRDVYIAFLIFDMTNRQSFEDLKIWKDKLDETCKHDLIPKYVIIGTKTDVKGYEIGLNELEDLALEWNCKSFTISCMSMNSSDIIYRIFYKTIEDFHTEMIEADKNRRNLPKLLKKHQGFSYINLSDNGIKKSCCKN